MASDTTTVLDALRAGTPIAEVADEHGWSAETLTALANGQRGWSIDAATGTVRIRDTTTAPPAADTNPQPAPEPEPEPADPDQASAPEPTTAETLAGGVEQLLADARACGDKRIERAALKAQTAIGVVEALYGPWLAEQKAAKARAKELAAAEKTAAKLRAQLEEAQAKVASLKGKPARAATGIPSAGRERSQAIRAWAKTRGIKVNERGRIPGHVVEQYDRENGGGDAST
ncbi:hypothetical protein G3I70_08455 [Actinomadura bangladeshensis]|uniref:Lsr2 DNA-binding domain-containing protein n=2 Tax=Actinomadura bangladeshensis TaxID=453573 RepID=A0A6L9Q7Y5_9ACTN|nr:hypothetical protein [Actinomadura bangladeshensis]NEA22519.1 hypothetical protein [Actinomadura bangladeshensis]